MKATRESVSLYFAGEEANSSVHGSALTGGRRRRGALQRVPQQLACKLGSGNW